VESKSRQCKIINKLKLLPILDSFPNLTTDLKGWIWTPSLNPAITTKNTVEKIPGVMAKQNISPIFNVDNSFIDFFMGGLEEAMIYKLKINFIK
jgi:hypothetical protein